MSVESSIASLISTLKTMSSFYRGEARNLIKKADDDLHALAIPAADTVIFDVDRDVADIERIPRPPILPGLHELELPEPDALQTIEQLTDEFTSTAPSLTSFTPSALDLPDAPEFSGFAPGVSQLSAAPTVPTIENALAPELTRPSVVTATPLSGTPPDVPIPAFTTFDGNVFAEYQDGLQLMGGDLQDWSTWLNALHREFSSVENQLLVRVQNALTGNESGLSDTWESGQYDQAQQALQAERYSAITALDDAPSSVTGLPTGGRVYQNLLLELKTLESKTQAAAKVAGSRHEQEVKHLQWALSTATRLIDVAISIKGQEAVWRMTGAMLALEGANVTLDTAEQVLAFKEKELSFITRYNDSQVRRTEDRLKIELTELEALKLEEANNQLIAAYNENQVQIYRVAAGFIETRIKLYQGQLEYLAVDVESRKLELQAFEADIQADRAKIKAHEALIAAAKARIKGDLVQTEAELLKVDQYESQLAAWAATQQIASAKIQAQIAHNKTLLDQYNAILSAQLQYLRTVDRFTQSAVVATVKRFDAEFAEQRIQLYEQQINDQTAVFNAINEMKIQQAELWKELQTHQVWLSQSVSQSQIINSSASVLGGIATQAFAGLNSVGATEILESA